MSLSCLVLSPPDLAVTHQWPACCKSVHSWDRSWHFRFVKQYQCCKRLRGGCILFCEFCIHLAKSPLRTPNIPPPPLHPASPRQPGRHSLARRPASQCHHVSTFFIPILSLKLNLEYPAIRRCSSRPSPKPQCLHPGTSPAGPSSLPLTTSWSRSEPWEMHFPSHYHRPLLPFCSPLNQSQVVGR